MHESSQWRLKIAQQVAPVIATNPRVQAIMLAGSTSRGRADRYSDIEIGVFWSGPPSDEERMAHIEPAGGVFWELDPYNPEDKIWMEEWGLGGLKMDVRNLTVEDMERILNDVIDHYDTSEFKQATISAVQYAIPLYNTLLLERWKTKLASYPEELGRAMVAEHLLLYEWCWQVEQLSWREDWPLVYSSLSEASRQMLAILMGLNHIYHPGLKWLNHLIGEMQIAPPDLATRLKGIFFVEPLTAIQETRKLVLDVYDLVDKHMPTVDTQEARKLFLRQRRLFEQPPLY